MSFATVFMKECRDNIRDRRALFTSFSLALIGPAFFVGMMIFVLDRTLGESDSPAEFTLVGAQYAPQLVAYLDQQNTAITHETSDDPQALVTSGAAQLVLVIPDDYADRYAAGQTNTLMLVHDSSELSTTRRNLAALRGYIGQYSRTISFLRLQLRGVDPAVVRPIQTQEVDVASPAARALTILASLPYFLVMVVFMGGFYLAIDTTAGEREHGSLEPLLTQPVSRTALVLGKICATAVFAGMSVTLFLASLGVAIPFIPFERIGMALEVNVAQLSAIFLICVPLILFAACLLTVVASFAKSYKEAQTYLTLVILVPTLPLIFAQLTGVDTSAETMWVPSLSQSTLMTDIIKGEPVADVHVAISVLATSLYAAVLAALAVYLYRREGILG